MKLGLLKIKRPNHSNENNIGKFKCQQAVKLVSGLTITSYKYFCKLNKLTVQINLPKPIMYYRPTAVDSCMPKLGQVYLVISKSMK